MLNTTNKAKFDIYQTVTDQIVHALESGLASGTWQRPWTDGPRSALLPVNVISRKPYRGVNVLCLWATAMEAGYSTNEWATYKQWKQLGAQVRKGERSTTVVFWKFFDASDPLPKGAQADEDQPTRRCMARAYHVFNAAQVDGYAQPAGQERPAMERHQAADQYFEAQGAVVTHGGNVAAYSPTFDRIKMPLAEAFKTPADYYSTLAHEHTHRTGHESRLARELSPRFKSDAYAAEELIAELGAAFICAQLGLESTVRDDHSQYIAHWLQVLKGDKYAVFTAARHAQAAVDYMNNLAGFTFAEDADADDVEMERAA
jgi:antirestriction protein ArdC